VVEPPTVSEKPAASIPRDQLRKVAFLYHPSQKNLFQEFAKLLDQVAQKTSRKPLFLERVFEAEFVAEAFLDPFIQKAKNDQAVSLILLGDYPESKVGEWETACGKMGLGLKWVTPGGAVKRSTAVDLVVDLMLMKQE
ncbi:MAG: hypothetical protein HY400_06165, partial [Elusimicrobia bacterium]|nr:hypothetical protein [Elusimicrobiota bacterium]